MKCENCNGTGKILGFTSYYSCDKCNEGGENKDKEKIIMTIGDEKYPLDNVSWSSSTIITDESKNFKIGRLYETRGKWQAICIWHETNTVYIGGIRYYFIHKPYTIEESQPIAHFPGGDVVLGGAYPTYNIVGEWRE